MRRLALVLFSLAAAGVIHAQNAVPARVEYLDTVQISRSGSMLADWAKLYFSGNWEALQATLRTDLRTELGKDLTFEKVGDADAVRLASRPYSVVFLSTARKPEGEVIRVLLQPEAPGPYSTTLPGVRTHYELHVKPVEAESLSTTYFSTATENPVVAQLAAFVKQFDPKLLAPVFPPFAGDAARTFFVDLRRVQLPFARATIAVEDDAATVADFAAKVPSLREEVTKLTASLQAREARNITCASHVVTKLDAHVTAFLAGGPTACAAAATAEERKKPWDVLQREIGCAYAAAVAGGACAGAASPAENALLVGIESRFKDLAKGGAMKVAGKATYANVPHSVIGLGVIAGIITAVPGAHDRYKVGGDGTLVLDPLTGGVSVAAVNIHPWRFDPSAVRLTPRERFRLFVGPVLTPEFGIAAGGGVAIIRGLSVNAGYGLVRINTLRDGDQPGVAPTNKNRPLRNSTSGFLFFGLGYNFK